MAPKDWLLTRVMDRVLGRFFRPFNRCFAAVATALWPRRDRRAAPKRRRAGRSMPACSALTAWFHATCRPALCRRRTSNTWSRFAQLPDGASLDRTEAVIRAMCAIALKQPGVESAVAFPGLSMNGFTNSSNAGIVFVTLKPFEERGNTASRPAPLPAR